MNRRNFLGMLSALPFVRGLSAPKPEPAISVEPKGEPGQGPLIEVSFNGQSYRARSVSIGGSVGAGQYIKVRGIEGWVVPLQRMLASYTRVKLRLLEGEWTGWLTSWQEATDDKGRLVTHVEFITDRRSHEI